MFRKVKEIYQRNRRNRRNQSNPEAQIRDFVKEIITRIANERLAEMNFNLHPKGIDSKIEFLKGTDVTETNEYGETRLSAAISVLNSWEFFEHLLNRTVHINVGTYDSSKPLYEEFIKHFKEKTVSLIANGSDVNAANDLGRTPLHEAVNFDREALKSALESYVSEHELNESDKERGVLMIDMLCKASEDILKALLFEEGALQKPDKQGLFPIDIAKSKFATENLIVAEHDFMLRGTDLLLAAMEKGDNSTALEAMKVVNSEMKNANLKELSKRRKNKMQQSTKRSEQTATAQVNRRRNGI